MTTISGPRRTTSAAAAAPAVPDATVKGAVDLLESAIKARDTGRPNAGVLVDGALDQATEAAKKMKFDPTSRRAVLDFGKLLNLYRDANGGSNITPEIADPADAALVDRLFKAGAQTWGKSDVTPVVKEALARLKTADSELSYTLMTALTDAVKKLKPTNP